MDVIHLASVSECVNVFLCVCACVCMRVFVCACVWVFVCVLYGVEERKWCVICPKAWWRQHEEDNQKSKTTVKWATLSPNPLSWSRHPVVCLIFGHNKWRTKGRIRTGGRERGGGHTKRQTERQKVRRGEREGQRGESEAHHLSGGDVRSWNEAGHLG